MERLFGKLSTPTAAVVILIFFLAVNGFLLYRQSATPTTTSAPTTPSSTTSTDTGSAAAPEEPSEPQRYTPDAPSTSAEPTAASETPIIGDLREAIRGCEGDRKECVRRFIGATYPESMYIGGRIDLNPDGSGRNKEILYFEDPSLGTCEHTRQEYVTNGRLTYTVIVLGQGSFQSERGLECIPET